jgi:SAM-dependent methyltransferase
MTTGDWSYGVDINVPSPARMYDYYLGGNHNFAADREAAEQAITAIPNLRHIASANRAFLRRAVEFLLGQGVRQFLDIGSGIPTVGNVHEIAAAYPGTRVVYVDTDPVAVAHSLALLHDNPNATAIRADLRYPDELLTHYNVMSTLDYGQPIGLLAVSVLQFVEDEAAYPAVARLLQALEPGSYLALSHVFDEAFHPDSVDAVADIYRRSTTPTYAHRDRDQILRFLHGLDLVEPGLVGVAQWTPGPPETARDDQDIAMLAAVARKPAGADPSRSISAAAG